jgi:hypothetical protein
MRQEAETMKDATMPHGVDTELAAGADQLLHRLTALADAMDNLSHLAYAIRCAEIEIPLGEASQSLYRALVALAPLCSCDAEPKGERHE